MSTQLDPYDLVAYRGTTRRSTHPTSIATTAALLGAPHADPQRCRVLEIGCGDGANLVPMALDLPDATFVGVDLAQEPVDRGRAAIEELGLPNARLVQADVRDLPDHVLASGPFDYVIAHGVYSWVPGDVRDALLDCCRRLLAHDGIAFVSYNANPGSFLRDAIRDAIAYGVPPGLDPAERIRQSHDVLRAIAGGSHLQPHGAGIAAYAEELLARPTWHLFHDELAPTCEGVYFQQFVDHAARFDLHWTFDAHLSDGIAPELPESSHAVLSALPDDVIVREQHLDFVRARMFRESLVRRGPRPDRGTPNVDVDAVAPMWVAGRLAAEDGDTWRMHDASTIEVHDASLRAVLSRIGSSWPAPVRLAEACDGMDDETRSRIGAALVRLHAMRRLWLLAHPPREGDASDHPRVSAWNRLLAGAGADRVVDRYHEPVPIDDEQARRMLTLTDGSRSAGAIAREMGAGLDDVVASIERLERLALLEAGATPTPAA